MILWNIETILYNRKPLDRGVILARRQYRSELARTQKPCQLLENGLKISFMTPHKRNMLVFVPESEITEGKTLTWLRYDEQAGKTLESEILIVEKSDHHCMIETLSERERVFLKRGRGKPLQKITRASFGMLKNPFMSATQPEPKNQAPDLILWDSQQFVKRSNFCFVWDPARKKRTGTPYKQVFPEEIQGETFRHDFEPYDILTGRKLDTFVDDVRREHFRSGQKPAPTWQAL